MYIKRILTLILAVVTLATAVSCSSGNGSQVSGSKSDGLKSGNSKELTMYVMNYDTSTQKAIEDFNTTHKSVQIKAAIVSSIPDDSLKSKLMYGLNNGEGPDIILCEEETFPNLSVYFDKGSFYDLNALISTGNSFRQSDYFKKVMDYGIYKGKRYVIPLSFKIDALYSTQELLEKGKIDVNNLNSDIYKFISAAGQYTASNAGKEPYFLSSAHIGSLLQTSAKQFFNLEEKTASFESGEFGELLDKYKLLSESAATKAVSKSEAEKCELFAGGKVILQSSGTSGPRYSTLPYFTFTSQNTPVLLPSPSDDSESHIIARPDKYIGINSKCGNVEAAYDFIKLMLSKEYQDTDMTVGIPVNRDAYEQAKANTIKGIKGYDSWKKGGCSTAKALKKLYSQLDKLLEGIDRCWTTDDYVLTLVEKEVDTYLDGNSTKEGTLKNIQTNVENYLKSGYVMDVKLKDADEAPVDPMKTLTLYYWDTPSFVYHSKEEFEKENPGIEIKIKTFDSFGDYQNTTAVELMAGGGPDIVTIQLRSFNSINKVVNSGVFCPMDEYIKKYDVLKFDEYNNKLLDGGIYGGKRYYIPHHYYGALMYSTKQLLADNNIKIEKDNWTWDKFIEYSKAFMKKPENKERYFLKGYSLYYMLVNSEDTFIEYEKKKSNFNTDSFKKLIKVYKELLPSIAQEGYISKKGYAFMCGGGSSEGYKARYEDLKGSGWGEMTIVPTPSFSGSQTENAIMEEGIAVNSRCQNKEAAFKFLKVALSYDMQRYYYKDGNPNGNTSMPVNNKAFGDDLKSYIKTGSLPKELVDQAIQTHKIIGYSQIKDYNVIEMVEEMVNGYIEGKKTADQVAKEIDDKVNVFLNE